MRNPAKAYLSASLENNRVVGLRKLQEALRKASTLAPMTAAEKKIVAAAKTGIAVKLKHKALNLFRRTSGRGK